MTNREKIQLGKSLENMRRKVHMQDSMAAHAVGIRTADLVAFEHGGKELPKAKVMELEERYAKVRAILEWKPASEKAKTALTINDTFDILDPIDLERLRMLHERIGLVIGGAA